MGTICILLGLIIFCVFVLGGCACGASLANMICNAFVVYSQNKGLIMAAIIAVFALIGLLICLNLVMHGLTYNKVNKLYRLMSAKKRSDRKDI